MATNVNLPPGFTLDEPQSTGLPPGFVMDNAPTERPSVGKVIAETAKDFYRVPLSLLSGMVSPITQTIAEKSPYQQEQARKIEESLAPKMPAGQFFTKAVSYPFTKTAQLEQKGLEGMGVPPSISPDLANLTSMLTLGGIGEVGSMAMRYKNAPPSMNKINSVIDTGINKGIRPSVVGQQTFPQMTKYTDKAREAVKTIVENKSNLQLTNELGEATNALPENLKQFSQAIDQTKRNIFKQYNDMALQAGEKGATIDLSPIAKELESITNKKPLQDLAPDIVKYADARKQSLAERGSYTAAEAQDAVATLNNSLDAFYKNPTYENASKASIDAMIANNLRKGLDSTIESVTSPGYQELKNKYGSLKTIERDVNRRAVVDARKNIKGLVDFSDIFSGSQVFKGIVTMNPAVVGQGIAAKSIASLYKYYNNPNTIIKRMFNKTENMIKAQPPVVPKTPYGKPVYYGDSPASTLLTPEQQAWKATLEKHLNKNKGENP